MSAARRGRAPTCGLARSDRDRTTRRSCSMTASPTLSLGFGGDRRGRHLSLHLRRLLPLHAVQRHRLRLRPRARADDRHRRRSGWPTPTCCPSSSRIWPIRCGRYIKRAADAAAVTAGRGARAEPARSDDGLFAAVRDQQPPCPAEAGRSARPELRAARRTPRRR